MSDAELIYNALLRTERRLEAEADARPKGSDMRTSILVTLAGLVALREELGRDLAKSAPTTKEPEHG